MLIKFPDHHKRDLSAAKERLLIGIHDFIWVDPVVYGIANNHISKNFIRLLWNYVFGSIVGQTSILNFPYH